MTPGEPFGLLPRAGADGGQRGPRAEKRPVVRRVQLGGEPGPDDADAQRGHARRPLSQSHPVARPADVRRKTMAILRRTGPAPNLEARDRPAPAPIVGEAACPRLAAVVVERGVDDQRLRPRSRRRVTDRGRSVVEPVALVQAADRLEEAPREAEAHRVDERHVLPGRLDGRLREQAMDDRAADQPTARPHRLAP